MTDSAEETGTQYPPLNRLPGGATSHGPSYEYKLAALLALRAKRAGLQFQLFSNVAAVRPWDDLVLRIEGERPVVYLVQLKHSQKDKSLNTQSWTAEKGDCALKKYFPAFQCIYNLEEQEGLEGYDMQILRSWNKEQLRLIMFTNKRVNKQSSSSEADCGLDFPYEHLFQTGDESNVSSFHNKDEEVWNLIKDDDYRNEFLPRLRVYSSQAHVGDLESLMEREIKEMFEKTPSKIKEYVGMYITRFKYWAESSKGHPKTDLSRDLEHIIAEDLRSRARDAAGNNDLIFKDEHCEYLKKDIRKHNTILYQAGLVPQGHRVAKVQQVLDEEFSGRWLYVDDHVVRDLPVSALTAASAVCDIIVVDVDRVPSQVKEFLMHMQEASKKIIVVTSESAINTDAFLGNYEFDHTMNEDWRLVHLTEDTQNVFMEKTVKFQGTLMPLSALEATWGHRRLREDVDGQLLSALLQGDATLGEAPAPPPDVADDASALRVPRTLVHYSVLRREALVRCRGAREHFVLWGFSREELKKLRREREAEVKRREESGEKKSAMEQETWEERFTELPDSVECSEEGALSLFKQKCSEQNEQNVHLVQNANGILLWRETRGSSNKISEFVKSISERCRRPYRSSCIHEESTMTAGGMFKDRNTPYLLLGVPGIGKSSYLYNVSNKQREKDPQHWSVVIRLLDHLELIEMLPEPGKIGVVDVERLVVAAAVSATPCAAAARRFLSAGLLETGRVNLFVDGVDEVVPGFKEKALKLLELLVEHKKHNTLLWIASRPEVDNSLRRRLNSHSVSLRPLSYEEQLTYLTSKWRFLEEGFVENATKTLAEEFINAFRNFPVEIESQDSKKQNNIDLQRSSLLAVPLNLRMAADAYADDARQALRNKSKLLKGRISLLHLVQCFIQLKRDRFRKIYGVKPAINQIKNFITTEEDVFFPFHQNYAMLTWTSSSLPEAKLQFEESVKKYQQLISREKSGILWKLEDGREQFVHYLFVEYFVAMWIFQNFKTKDTKKFILIALQQRSQSTVSLFLDLMLAENLPLHNAIIDDRNIDKSLLLNNKKIVDQGGRSALHLAAVYGRTGAVEALLDAGCDGKNSDSLLSKTPLQYADTTLQLEVIDSFLQRKFDPKELTNLKTFCANPHLLKRVITKDLVHVMGQLLEIEQKTNFEAVKNDYLHDAVASGAEKIVEMFLRKGHDVNSLNENKQTPLHVACSSNQNNIAMILLENGANVNHVDEVMRTPLHETAISGNDVSHEFL